MQFLQILVLFLCPKNDEDLTMTKTEIENILKMRFAVYKAGIKSGFWKDLSNNGGIEMMEYIFPKSGYIAFYNLILELMRKEHSEIRGGSYTLFKMPIMIEKEIMDYLKNEKINFDNLVENEQSYLESQDTIVTAHGFSNINIGSFATTGIDNLLKLCASHYLYSFKNNVKTYFLK